MFLRMIRWLRSLYLRQIWLCFVFVGPCPVLCCFAVLLWGETQIWLEDLRGVLVVVVLLFFVCLWFRDDLPKFLDHTCPCTLVLFIAYAIVRTEPSATSAKPEEKTKKTLCYAMHCRYFVRRRHSGSNWTVLYIFFSLAPSRQCFDDESAAASMSISTTTRCWQCLILPGKVFFWLSTAVISLNLGTWTRLVSWTLRGWVSQQYIVNATFVVLLATI